MRPRLPSRRPSRRRPRTSAARRRRNPRCGAVSARGGWRSRCSRLEPQVGLAHADHVARGQLPRAVELHPVHEGPVRRAGVLVQTPSRRGPTRTWCADANSSSPRSMSLSDERPSVTGAESSVRSLSTFSAGLARTTRLPVRRAAQTGRSGLLRREHKALLGEPDIARHRANDPPDEEVKQDQEANLQPEKDGLDLDRRQRHRERLKTSSLEPRVIRSSSSRFARFSARPLTATPFVESRSTIQKVEPSRRISACRREMFRIDDADVGFLRPADDHDRLLELVLRAVDLTVAGSASIPSSWRRLLPSRTVRLGRYASRRARHRARPAPRGGRAGSSGSRCRRGLPRGPRPSGRTPGARQELVALSPSVLGQIILELLTSAGS